MKRLLGEEGERTMRLLTRRDKGFQPRLIDAIQQMLARRRAAGRLDLPVDLRDVAYVVVRLIESYVYLDIITGEEPDARRAEPVLQAAPALRRRCGASTTRARPSLGRGAR